MTLAAGYQHFADGPSFAEIVLRHPAVREVYFPWPEEPSGRPRLRIPPRSRVPCAPTWNGSAPRA